MKLSFTIEVEGHDAQDVLGELRSFLRFAVYDGNKIFDKLDVNRKVGFDFHAFSQNQRYGKKTHEGLPEEAMVFSPRPRLSFRAKLEAPNGSKQRK